MLTPDVHPPREGEPAFALDREHHDHGPLGPDDFAIVGTDGADLCEPNHPDKRGQRHMIGNPNNHRREAVRKAQALARAAAEAVGKAHAPAPRPAPAARALDAIGGP